MSENELEEKLTELFESIEDEDYTSIEDFIEENGDDYEGDINELAFRIAVREGHRVYVENHAGDVDLNDDCGSSTYLDETDDPDVIEALMDAGACRPLWYYEDYALAIETTNWEIIVFKDYFQEEVYDRFLEVTGLTEDDIIAYLNEDSEEESEDESEDKPEFPESLENFSMEEVCELLHIALSDNGKVVLNEYDEYESAGDLMTFVEALGWKFNFEGESWKLETTGVYFIDEE